MTNSHFFCIFAPEFKSFPSFMKKIITSLFALMATMAIYAGSHVLQVKTTHYQTITGFGGACCDGAMKPNGTDTWPVKHLYGDESKIGLNILRMEISPSFEGDNWGDYDWNGSLPSARIVKQRGGIVFGTPWSPPGEYKTNGSASGGKVNDQNDNDPQNKRGKLREDCYEKFFPWLNTFLEWMQNKGVNVDAVSIQNEPDWWVNYSGCLYSPEEQLKLVKDYAHLLDRERFNGVRLISGEPLGFTKNYSDPLMRDPVAREQIDIVAGHLYGHAPLNDNNMKGAAVLATQYGKEIWMTEHSVSDQIKGRLPNWDEQLEFARELNECMVAGATGYIYWYLRAHWAFIGTGETNSDGSLKYGSEDIKNRILPRAYVMSHFSKNVTGSTRVETRTTFTTSTNSSLESSAYVKGDSIIVMVINSTTVDNTLKVKFPVYVKSGTHLLSTGNDKNTNLCQKSDIPFEKSVTELLVDMPAKSVNTYVFMVDQEATAIEEVEQEEDEPVAYYDLQGRPLDTPQGFCVEKYADGTSRKIFMRN